MASVRGKIASTGRGWKLTRVFVVEILMSSLGMEALPYCRGVSWLCNETLSGVQRNWR